MDQADGAFNLLASPLVLLLRPYRDRIAAPTSSPHVDFTDPPTPETAWRRFVESLAPFDRPPPTAALVVAPHPDDETLAIGGTVATWATAGTFIEVVAVTDGEASHPGAPGLAERRAEEQRVALAALGVTAPPIRLRLPDTGVAAHHQLLVTTLSERLVGRGPVTVILAPWELDAHGDHDAVGRAALAAAAQTGATCVRFPVWAWQWATPETFAGLDLRRLPLSPDATRRKTTAVACFPSQTEVAEGSVPILSPGFLERFRRPSEVLIEPLNA